MAKSRKRKSVTGPKLSTERSTRTLQKLAIDLTNIPYDDMLSIAGSFAYRLKEYGYDVPRVTIAQALSSLQRGWVP